jgi:hypothetical protein
VQPNQRRRGLDRRFFCLALMSAVVSPIPRAVAQDRSELLGRGMPYDKFDALPMSTLVIGGGKLDIAFVPEEQGERREAILRWVKDSADAITTYFGRFPVARLRLLIVQVPGDEIHGTTWGYRGAATRIRLGERARNGDVIQSWVLTHEMVHVSFPQIPDEQLWLEEGLATYVEPVARAQAGQIATEEVWGQFLWGMPKGLPQPGDRGLDYTHTWGRTYWGGALFCLIADIDIRSRTGNRRSLQDALRAIISAGGNAEVEWPLARALQLAQEATGVSVLDELYERQRATPVATDLDHLWQRLGVTRQNGRIVLDDAAPLAGIRRAITQAPGAAR